MTTRQSAHMSTLDERQANTEKLAEPDDRNGRDVLDRVLQARDRHRSRPLPARVALDTVAIVISIVGVVLLIEPEIGLPVLLGGLRLLAYEFDWAARSYARVERRWQRVRARYKRLLSSKLRVVGVAVVLAIAVAAAVTAVELALR